MKQVIKKLMACALAVMMLFGVAACNTGSGDGDYTRPEIFAGKNPFDLKIYSFNGGYGVEWLRALEERYEAVRMDGVDDEFTIDGVTYDSVDIRIETSLDTMTTMTTNWAGNNHIYFHEHVKYASYIRNDSIVEDITEIIKADNPYEDGTGSILDKFTQEQKTFYNMGTDDEAAYYGIPHYAGYVGLSYNKEIFDTQGFYIRDGYKMSDALERRFTNEADKKSAGPDGKKSTSDDGLPTTYDEFFMLCSWIKNSGYAPITWPGKYRQEYLNWFLTSLTANYEGLSDMSLNYSSSGTANHLVKEIKADGTVELEDPTAINWNNGYLLAKQAGRYYALDFLEKILDNGYNATGTLNDSHEHITAQKEFVQGPDNTQQARPVMYMDGVWWKMEASSAFAMLKQAYPNENHEDKFAWMPLPSPTADHATARAAEFADGGDQKGFTLLDTHNSLAFVQKGINKDIKTLAGDFLQFAYTDKSLKEFNEITDTTKAVRYSMTAEEKNNLSVYGRSLMETQEKSDIVYSFAKNDFYLNNELSLVDYKSAFDTKLAANAQPTTSPTNAMTGSTEVSAKAYFEGLVVHREDLWGGEIVIPTTNN